MANIMDYLKWRGDIPFSQVPVNAVDSLVFAALSYLKLDGLAPEGMENPVPLWVAAEALLALPDAPERAHTRADLPLLQAAAQSPRFRGVRLCAYHSRTLYEEETQFAAMAFLMADGSAFLAFRGTDATLVGWKEDFNMSFQDTVPAQLEALRYTEGFAAVFDGPLYLTGHSKGGNLAVFAAARSAPFVQDRMRGVYNHDGPGFGEYLMGDLGYQRMVPKIRTFVPESSIIGMLLEHEEPYTAVKSTQVSILQHDLYSWEVLGGGFVQAEDVSGHSKRMNQSIKTWLSGMEKNERIAFVDALYAVLSAGGAKKVGELSQPRNIRLFLKAMQADESKRKILTGELMEFLRILGDTAHAYREKQLKAAEPEEGLQNEKTVL